MNQQLIVDRFIVERFKQYFKALHRADLAKLATLYEENVVFRDPIQEVRGLVGYEDYLERFCVNLQECRFEYLDELVSDGSAYIKWVVHYRHPRIAKQQISVRGMTHIQFTDKIHFHEDIYDVGSLIYEHLPIAGVLTRWIKRQIAI